MTTMQSQNKEQATGGTRMVPPLIEQSVSEWLSYGIRQRGKLDTEEEKIAARERRINCTKLKKRLATELQDRKNWSERQIEKELDRRAEEITNPSSLTCKKEKQKLPAYMLDPQHPDNVADHRGQNGPLLSYLWCSPEQPKLQGQTLYLGGEVGSDGNIYCIPGHAPRVLVINTKNDTIYPIGPPSGLTSNGRLFKWLRGIAIGDTIYGLPCHADEVLKIHVPTQTISKIPIPYEELYPDDEQEAQKQRSMIWKYHGGSVCPLDGCIYAIPQSASRVLKIDPTNETCTLVGPALEGKYKWYGGIVGKSDGAIYGIPQCAAHVLRISPTAVTLHGNFEPGNHKWHGGTAASNGVIVSIPANKDTVLCITPGDPAPLLTEIGNSTIIQSGRHRSDGKYKYLGGMCGTNGKVYLFPCASEYVLQIDTVQMITKNVGPNLRDAQLENVNQNKWQNGLTCLQNKCVYGMPLSGETLLKIDCSNSSGSSSKSNDGDDDDPEVTTWILPSPRRDCRDKFEGGVITADGIMYTIPNNHKGVLRIQPKDLVM